MKDNLYVANLAPEVDESQLRTLFQEYGDVTAVELGINERYDVRYGLVRMSTEKIATRANHALNGHELAGRRLAVSYAEVDEEKELTSRQKREAEQLAADLAETDKVPVRQITTLIQLCGSSFAQAIAEEAKQVCAGEGLSVADGSRRRTLGGVFFYLTRPRVSPPVHHIVFQRKGKFLKPVEAAAPVEET
ncbi:MAG: hypothetical protein JW910_01955 [Anaerolineae bacterium]|nr:hypothetical protein [Anaerolineae bacterium]